MSSLSFQVGYYCETDSGRGDMVGGDMIVRVVSPEIIMGSVDG